MDIKGQLKKIADQIIETILQKNMKAQLFILIVSSSFNLFSQTAEEWTTRGDAQLNKEDSNSAIICFNNAIDINPNYSPAYLGRAMAKGDLGDFKGALSDLNKCISYFPAPTDAPYYLRGVIKRELGDYRGSISDFNKAIEINSTVSYYYFYRGLSKLLLNEKDNGCLDLSKAGELGYYEAYDTIKELCN